MIPSYCQYISQYVRGKGPSSLPAPGEHHFVSAYLVPKLFAIDGKVPDYINPDGTKAILGDIVYYRDGRHHFGIEVKLGTVRLTKREFNEWIVATDTNLWPDLFIGIGSAGIGLAKWREFRHAYIAAVRDQKPDWSPRAIADGYGPMKGVNQLLAHLSAEAHFPWSDVPAQVSELEASFTNVLRSILGVNPSLKRTTRVGNSAA